MILPQLLARQCSSPSAHSPSRLRALCLIGWLGAASACTGKIDNNPDRSGLRPATSGNTNGQSTGTGTATGMSRPAPASGSRELGGDNIQGLDGESSASGGRGRGGAARPPRADELESDAGLNEPVDDCTVDA